MRRAARPSRKPPSDLPFALSLVGNSEKTINPVEELWTSNQYVHKQHVHKEQGPQVLLLPFSKAAAASIDPQPRKYSTG